MPYIAPYSELPVSARRAVRGKPNLYPIRRDDSGLVLGRGDDHGCHWFWHNLDGWFGTQDLDVVVTPIGRTSRARAATRFSREPRNLTITGTCAAPHVDVAMEARERLYAAWGDPDVEFDLIMDEPTPKRLRGCRLAGPIETPWAKPVKTFTFQIPVVAPDGTKYSLSPTSVSQAPLVPGGYSAAWDWEWTGPDLAIEWESNEHANTGALECHNAGSLEAPATFMLRGPLGRGWRVDNLSTGQRMGFDISLAQGQTLVVDTRDTLAYINTVPVAARLRGSWLQLAPGRNRLLFTDPTYQGTSPTMVTVTWHSTWR